jgi:hypothetical protein
MNPNAPGQNIETMKPTLTILTTLLLLPFGVLHAAVITD